jgi:hypothetical protein
VDEEFVVLDDITPYYLSANAALNACNAAVAVTLHALGALSDESRNLNLQGLICSD